MEDHGNKIAVYVGTTNDVNGNPRRGWVIVGAYTGDTLDFVNEGYNGTAELRSTYPGIIETGRLDITVRQYNALRKEYDK